MRTPYGATLLSCIASRTEGAAGYVQMQFVTVLSVMLARQYMRIHILAEAAASGALLAKQFRLLLIAGMSKNAEAACISIPSCLMQSAKESSTSHTSSPQPSTGTLVSAEVLHASCVWLLSFPAFLVCLDRAAVN